MNANQINGRLSTWAAAYVIARRDFTAILFSRSFIFFLLGPLFPVIVGGFAGGIGQRVQASADRPVLASNENGPRGWRPVLLRVPEAPVGIEPTNGGFADLCLTTWLRRRGERS